GSSAPPAAAPRSTTARTCGSGATSNVGRRAKGEGRRAKTGEGGVVPPGRHPRLTHPDLRPSTFDLRPSIAAPRWQLPALLALTALAALFAWQARQPFALDVGAPNDDPYLGGFHDGETGPDGQLTYRWTR